MSQMPGQQPQGYYPPPPPQGPPTNVMAIIALVCAFILFPAGLVCGIIARKQIKDTGEAGAGLALAAIIISIVQFVFLLLFFVFFIIFFVIVAETVSNFPTPSPSPFN